MEETWRCFCQFGHIRRQNFKLVREDTTKKTKHSEAMATRRMKYFFSNILKTVPLGLRSNRVHVNYFSGLEPFRTCLLK